MTPDALLAAFHAQVRLRDADGSVDNVLEHVGLVRRNYSADPHTGWAMIESPEGLGADPDAAAAGLLLATERAADLRARHSCNPCNRPRRRPRT